MKNLHKLIHLKMQLLQLDLVQSKFLLSNIQNVFLILLVHLDLKEVPDKLVVIGGGYIGTELGAAYANFGTQVTILEGADDILAGFEKQMTAIVKKNLKKKGAEIVTKAMAKGVEETENGVVVTYEVKGEEKKVEADYVFVTVGRRPNTDEMGLEQVGIKMN